MKRLSNFALVAFAVFALNSCGGDKTEDTHDQHAVPTESVETVTDETSTTSNNLSIDSNDQMQFTKNELRASVGTITITLNHVGKMPKESMGHNLVILKPGTDIPAFAQKAVAAKETNYIPESEKDNVIAATTTLGGGESDTIEFTISEKGTYDFICSFPGHYAMMKGQLIVE